MYGLSIDKNSVHGSDSVENGKIEINFFFKKLFKYNLIDLDKECSCFKTFFFVEFLVSFFLSKFFFVNIIFSKSNRRSNIMNCTP